jgi:hypothetical protein
MMATQIAMGPWFFRMAGKPYGPGCDISILRRLLAAGRIKPDAPIRGPGSHQLWRRVRSIPGVAHLAGLCHSCGSKVKADGKFCPDCGTPFQVPTERNQWGLPSRPAAEVVAELRKSDPALCCICGHDKTGADECPECDTVFSPPEEATRITLGGWFVHGKQHAFKPGMSYEQLRKEAELGGVTSRTIVRGPTTEQFWKLAKNTQGVAHLTGFCHQCGTKAQAGDASCASCKASFAVPADADWVGLRYPTADSAAGAQQHLDEELAKIAATMPPAPPKPRRRTQAEVDDDAVETVAELDEGGDDIEVLDLPPGYGEGEEPSDYASDDFESQEEEPEDGFVGAGAPADAGGFDLGVTAAPTAGRERRLEQQYKKSQSTLIAWLVITPIVVIGAFFAINALSGKKEPKEGKDGSAQKDGAIQHKAEASPQLAKLKQDTEKRLAQFKGAQGKAGTFLKQAETTMAAAMEMYNGEQFLEADAQFRKVEAPLLEIERMQQQRGQATESRGRAQAAQNEAKALVAAQHAKEHWDQAEASFALGAKLLDDENYDQAIVAWTSSAEQYGKASRLVQVMLTAADVRAKIEADAIKTFSKDELDRENIPAWNALKGKLKAGDDAAVEKNYEQAMQFYDQARLMVPSLDFAMKLQIGRSYYAYQAGRLTARIIKDKAGGNHPDEQMLAALKQAYENLQINRDFFNRVPKSPKSSFKEFAEVLILDCGKEIEASFEENGAAIKASFGLGLQVYQVEKLLRLEIGKLSPATRSELELNLKRVIPDGAKNAGYSAKFLEDVKEVEETLATETNIPTKSREKWAALVEKLEQFDTAIRIVTAKK